MASKAMVAPLAAATEAPAARAMSMLRLVARHNVHPQLTLHPSWLPGTWPARHRAVMRGLQPTAQIALGDTLRRCGVITAQPDYHFDSRLKRLLLLDPSALRRLAFYVSLCAHAPLLRPRRDVLSAQLRRQARRFDDDAVEFVLNRAPQLTQLNMAEGPLKEHPWSCGLILIERGYRLLLAALLREGAEAVERVQRKLPRRLAALQVPQLQPKQLQQLDELMLSCLIPERIGQWDWLF